MGSVKYFVYKQKERVGVEHMLCLWAARWNQWTRSLHYHGHRVRRFCLLGQHTSIMDVTLNTSIDIKLYHFLHYVFPAGRVHWTREKEILKVNCDAPDCVSVTPWLSPHFGDIVRKIDKIPSIGLVFCTCVTVYTHVGTQEILIGFSRNLLQKISLNIFFVSSSFV